MVRNFRFVEPGRIALSGLPETAGDVDWLREQGIRSIVSLHPVPSAARARMQETGIVWRPFLIADFAEGTPAKFLDALEFVRRSAEADPAVLVH